MATAAYLRVSTDLQDHKSQRLAISTYLRNHDITDVRWYEDTITGKVFTRKDFDRLQHDIFMGEVRMVVVFKLDRIARRMREGINIICEWVDKGVRVVSTTQDIDLSGPVGRMIAAVLLGLAEIEAETIRDRIKAGMAVAKAAGKCKGRKPGSYVANPMRAKELHMRGLTYKEIAVSLNISMATVFRYMKIG